MRNSSVNNAVYCVRRTALSKWRKLNTHCMSHTMTTGNQPGTEFMCKHQCMYWWHETTYTSQTTAVLQQHQEAESCFPTSHFNIYLSLFPSFFPILHSQEKKRCQAINIVMRAVVLRPDILHAHQHKSNDYYPRAL